MKANGERLQGTRDRLLAVAGEIFAAKGYQKATVREIVAKAGANLNAINYHFGDKQNLYQAVLEHGHLSLEEDASLLPARNANLDPSDRLRAFIRSFLQRMLAKDGATFRMKLMAREMAQPTGALDMVIERYLRPRFELLMEIIGEITGSACPHAQLKLCAVSIIGQCVHLVHGRAVVSRMISLAYTPEDVERLVDHVTRFSLAALANMASRCEDGR